MSDHIVTCQPPGRGAHSRKAGTRFSDPASLVKLSTPRHVIGHQIFQSHWWSAIRALVDFLLDSCVMTDCLGRLGSVRNLAKFSVESIIECTPYRRACRLCRPRPVIAGWWSPIRRRSICSVGCPGRPQCASVAAADDDDERISIGAPSRLQSSRLWSVIKLPAVCTARPVLMPMIESYWVCGIKIDCSCYEFLHKGISWWNEWYCIPVIITDSSRKSVRWLSVAVIKSYSGSQVHKWKFYHEPHTLIDKSNPDYCYHSNRPFGNCCLQSMTISLRARVNNIGENILIAFVMQLPLKIILCWCSYWILILSGRRQ